MKPSFETLQIETKGKIGHLILNRPGSMNALNATLLKELRLAANWFDTQMDIQVVVVKGEGKAFSVGADLKDNIFEGADKMTWVERREIGQLGAKMIEAIRNMRAVTIAQIHKYAIGGGCLLAMVCDFKIVAAGTVFSIPEVDLGIPLSWGGIPFLVREFGPTLAKDLVMTCRRFTPEEALTWRMINQIVPMSQLEATCEELANQLAAKPSVPLLMTKEHINSVTDSMGDAGNRYSDGDALISVVNDPGYRKAAEEYLKKNIRKA